MKIKNGKSSRHEEARKLGELGSNKAAESDLERHMIDGAKKITVLLRSVYDVLPRSLWQIVRRKGRGHGVSQWWLACGALLENPCGDP